MGKAPKHIAIQNRYRARYMVAAMRMIDNGYSKGRIQNVLQDVNDSKKYAIGYREVQSIVDRAHNALNC